MDELHTRLGVKLLGFQMEGFIGIGSTKPVNEPLNPEVKKGILLRIPNMEVFKLGAEAMGYRTITSPGTRFGDPSRTVLPRGSTA